MAKPLTFTSYIVCGSLHISVLILVYDSCQVGYLDG